MINDSWWNCNNIQELKSFCSADLEFLTIKCRPYYLPRELSSIIVTAMYIPPHVDTKTAIKELHSTLCKLETIYPEAAFIVAGVNEFIRKCIGDVVPTVTIKTFPKQKPWIGGSIRTKLLLIMARQLGIWTNTNSVVIHSVRQSNEQCQYRDKVESQFNG